MASFCCTSSGLVIAAMNAGSARDDGRLQQYVSCKQKIRVVSVSNARCFGTAEDCIVSVNGVNGDVTCQDRREQLGTTSLAHAACRPSSSADAGKPDVDILESPGKCTLTVLRPTDPWRAAVSSRAVFP